MGLSDDRQRLTVEGHGGAGLTRGEGGYGGEEGKGAASLRGWIIVCIIAVAFVVYGFFAFLFIGDKGPPDWDAGAVKDVPGSSDYSTAPLDEGAHEPEPQHVAGMPPEAGK